MKTLLLLLISLVFLSSIQTASLTPNYKSACTLISTRIYCYSGGYASLGDVVIKRALDEHHYLDLTQTLKLDETSARWMSIPDDMNFLNEPTLASTSTSVVDSAYIIDGGYNDTPFVKNITRLFDTKSNTWSSISNNNRNLSNNAIYMGTAVNVPNKGRIYYWGGLSGQYPGYPVNTTTILSTKNPMYTWSVCPGVLPLGTFTRFGHTATLDNDGINIFYLGGRIRTVNVTTVDDTHSNDSNLIPYNIIPMNKILSYNTIDASWSARESPSAPTMSSRYMHSANLLPYSGKILIYGGATDDGNEKHPSAVSDYLYLFDPKTLEYTRIEEYEQTQGAGPRFGHSAILCNNTLFVLFGVNEKGLITNDVYFLSLSNSATWLTTFSLLGGGGDGADNKVGGTWLSNQAITGITIGSVLVIIFLLVGSIYMIHTTRSKKKKLLQEQEDFKKLQDSDLPQLHKQYQRYSTVDSIQMSGQERYFNNNNDIPNEYDTYVISSDSVTLHDNIPPRGFSYDHLVIPSSINIHKPNQVKDQQPLTFIEGQQQQSSTGSFFLQPTTPISNTSSVPSASIVKPSV